MPHFPKFPQFPQPHLTANDRSWLIADSRQPTTESGYAVLGYILTIIVLLMLIIIPIQGLSLINTRSAATATNTRQNFYGTESAIYDTISRIVGSNYTWPPDPPYSVGVPYEETFEFNDIQSSIITIRLVDGGFEITATSNFQNTTRTLRADLQPSTSTQSVPSDIMIVMDTSGSMEGSPLAKSIAAAKTLIDTIDDNNSNATIGVAEFHNYGIIQQPLTSDLSQAKSAVDNLDTGVWTNIGDGIRTATEELDTNGRGNANRYIVILSDGVANRRGIQGSISSCSTSPQKHTDCTCDNNDCPDSAHPESAIGMAYTAKSKGYILFAIGLGLNKLNNHPGNCNSPPCGTQAVARDTLLQSSSGGNRYFEAPNENDLQTIYQEIGFQINLAPLYDLYEIR